MISLGQSIGIGETNSYQLKFFSKVGVPNFFGSIGRYWRD